MNLLSNGQNNDLEKKILITLKEIGLNDKELGIAQEFFYFSKEMDLSLLQELKCRLATYTGNQRNSCTLFNELLRLPKDKSDQYTKRYILFLEAIAGNTIGRFTFYGYGYYSYSDDSPDFIRRAYEVKYSPDDVQEKLAAMVSYGINELNQPFNRTIVNKDISAKSFLQLETILAE